MGFFGFQSFAKSLEGPSMADFELKKKNNNKAGSFFFFFCIYLFFY